MVENIIVIEVIEVDELEEGNILSSSSTSMTISAVAGKQEKQVGPTPESNSILKSILVCVASQNI